MGVTGFGKPKYNAGGREWETFKLIISKTDDMADNIYRILPPIHRCAEAGIWQYYTSTHYSYGGVNPADPSKPKIRPFRCIEDKDMRTKMIKVSCPECEEAYRLKAKLEEVRAALAAQGKTEKEVKAETQALDKAARSHEPTRKWHSWAVGADGKIGLLPYSHTLKKKIDEMRKKLEKKGIDMLDPDSGIFVNFRRKGNPPNLQEEVEPVTEQITVEGEVVDKIKRAPLTQDQANNILTMLEKYDLREQGGTLLTAQQIEMLVKCNGDPEEVDRIFGISQKAPTQTPAQAPAPAPQPVAPPAALVPAPSPVTLPPVPSTPPAPVTPPQVLGNDATAMAALQAQMAELQAKLLAAQALPQTPAAAAPAPTPAPAENVAPVAAPAATTPPAPAPAAPTATPQAPASGMSNEDFLKMFP